MRVGLYRGRTASSLFADDSKLKGPAGQRIGMMNLLMLACLLQTQEPDAPYTKAVTATKKAREALAEMKGVRAVSMAGMDGIYRLLVSVEDDTVRDEVRKVVGYEYEGLRVNVYGPATRAALFTKPKEGEPVTTPSSKAKEEPAEKKPSKREKEAAEVEATIRTLEAKEFKSGSETVSMIELLQCDGMRIAFDLPEIKREKKEGRCTYCVRTVIGGIARNSTSPQHITKHREACPFLEERLIDRLPADAIVTIKKMAELLAKQKKLGK